MKPVPGKRSTAHRMMNCRERLRDDHQWIAPEKAMVQPRHHHAPDWLVSADRPDGNNYANHPTAGIDRHEIKNPVYSKDIFLSEVAENLPPERENQIIPVQTNYTSLKRLAFLTEKFPRGFIVRRGLNTKVGRTARLRSTLRGNTKRF